MRAVRKRDTKVLVNEPFKGLFTQGMVCHETYKDQNNNWLSPDEVISINEKKYLKSNPSKEVIVGPSESMSKSKKNTIDPENIIELYGADSVRLFILSDSPPEKDVQWSDQGILASYKFIQKFWVLHLSIIDEIKKNNQIELDNELEKFTNKIIKKITDNLNNFSYNVLVANLHEIYSFLKKEIVKDIKKETLLRNYKKILIVINPIIPHITNEALEMLNISEGEKVWPTFDKKIIIESTLPIVIQINGKKRGLIEINRDSNENDIMNKIIEDKNIKKYFESKKIIKKIFVPNKLINIIV